MLSFGLWFPHGARLAPSLGSFTPPSSTSRKAQHLYSFQNSQFWNPSSEICFVNFFIDHGTTVETSFLPLVSLLHLPPRGYFLHLAHSRRLPSANPHRPSGGTRVCPLHPTRWRYYTRRIISSARQRGPWHAMWRAKKGKGHPPLGGHDVRHRPDQQGPRTVTQHHTGGPDLGYLLQGHVRSGAVPDVCTGLDREGWIRCPLCQRRPSNLHQAG